MKLNWKTVKVVIAFVVIFGIAFWAVDSVRSRSYSGVDLKFGVGSGPVTVTNPSDEAVLVQLVGTGSRTFSISSTIEDVTGSSARQGSGNSSTQLFEFGLPPGTSEFTIKRGTNVNFTATTDTKLEASVQSASADESSTTIIVAVVATLGVLFYISRTTDHRWISILRRQGTPVPDLKPVTEGTSGGQGRALRSYGDNTSDISS